ncbi:MAG: aromatic aminobenezylarsenical efflux permease ArsG family transporter [Candidatus Eisenbacteria bacterium]|nr:aromatic aminobenezylarsenical efflux permease ArsG family transporter [Candidatus Eisenbacteria bacterium]
MTSVFVAIGTALWLGILTSISPCPLASNIAAISFVGRNAGSPRKVLLAGLLYSLGRALTYVLISVLVVSSVLSIPAVSFFLQQRMNQVLGPLLIVIGIGIFGWLRLPLPQWSVGETIRARTARAGLAGAGALGMLFALSFCPVSAGLFFGALIPLAVSSHSRGLLPAVYGIGTGLPVVAFAVLLVLGARGIGRAFSAMTRVERAGRPITGAIFVLAGLYLTVVHVLGVNLL